MGYYGMPAQKRPPGARTPLEEALISIKVAIHSLVAYCVSALLTFLAEGTRRVLLRPQTMESLDILSKLLMNAAVAPKEDKFRRIRLR